MTQSTLSPAHLPENTGPNKVIYTATHRMEGTGVHVARKGVTFKQAPYVLEA